ncbi:MAG: IS110 family transposase [Bacteroidota bacterium]
METSYVGIDIAKDSFEIFFANTSVSSLPNHEAGWQKLLTILPTNAHCVLEYTGVYSLGLATFLYDHQLALSVINPLTAKHFSAMQLSRAKTDKADARLLCLYGETHKPTLWKPQESHIQQIRQLYALLDQYQKQHLALNNFAKQQALQTVKTTLVTQSLDLSISHLKDQITQLETQLRELIEKHHGDLFDRLQSIPGIGPATAMILISMTQGFENFDSVKQLIAYVGLAPKIFQSGKAVFKKTHICKMGTARLRKSLYIATWSAIRFNQPAKELYQRLKAKGKASKVALIAVANKLLKQAFAIAKSGQVFDPNFAFAK